MAIKSFARLFKGGKFSEIKQRRTLVFLIERAALFYAY